MTRVVVAPNAFKGSLSALAAAGAMCSAVAVVRPDAELLARPLADGGDGSVDALITSGYGRHDVPVRLPDGRSALVPIALQDGRAVVELANTCGLVLTTSGARQPMVSNTMGLADAVAGALSVGADEIVLCVGGSASTDGGVGLVRGLGARLIDDHGDEVPPGGRWLRDISSIDVTGLDPRLSDVSLVVATDVSSPLFGPDGAAHVFAPQKGASPEEVAELDAGLRSWAAVVAQHLGRDLSSVAGAGAAGGTAFAAIALLGAAIVPGADFIATAIGLDKALEGSDLLLTGEGSLDDQSLLGKGAVNAARRAKAIGVPTIIVCGRLDVPSAALDDLGVVAAGSLLDIATADEAMSDTAALLTRRTIEILAHARSATS